jgi:hypothetical protein
VTIQVSPVNDGPTATPDQADTDGRPVSIQVLANDSDPDGDVLRVASYTAPSLGRVTRAGGTLVYTPNPGATGQDVFTYAIVDAGGATAKATVTVDVTDTVAPEVQTVSVRYGSLASAVHDFGGLSRSVLPWSNVTAFSFRFGEEVTIDPAALSLTDGTGAAVDLNFAYNTATRTGTWTAADGALPIGRYSLRLDGSLVVDGSSNPMAADWGKAFAVLPGDYDGNGLVDDIDVSAIRAAFTRPGVPLNRLADVNGSGLVNDADLTVAETNRGRRI